MIDVTRILCPVDLSDISRHALDHAVALARWYEAQLTVLYVSPPPPLPMPVTGFGDVPVLPPVQPDVVADDVHRFCGPLPDLDGGPPTIVLKEGDPARAILQQAEHADLLVMGTHGRGGFERLFLGSVTEKVIRTTHVPVLTVPPPVERPEAVAYKTILCPVEFSSPSIRALEYALSLAKETDARLILLHVVEWSAEQASLEEVGHLSVREYYRSLEEDAMARLKAAVPAQARDWCTPVERVVHGKASREILALAAAEKAEVIVMGVHGKGPLHVRLFGSTTHHVIREAGCPVLTLRG
jgi:nucleotide-binding universal stress UspA family protein